MTVPSRGAEQFNLRMPAGLREDIRKSAQQSVRSMNSEIIVLIQRGLAANGENEKGDAPA